MTSLMKSLNGDGRYGVALLLLIAVLLALAAGGDPIRSVLEWERAAIGAGQVHRLVTGHFVHLDIDHAVLNCVGLVLVWALYARLWSPREWLLVSLVALAVIDAGLWFGVPSLRWYVGASGLLHGLLVAGLVGQWRTERGIAVVVGVLLTAKLVTEQWHGALPFAEPQQYVVLASHAFGAIGGLVSGVTLALRRKRL